jgi:CHAT domain-containing protein
MSLGIHSKVVRATHESFANNILQFQIPQFQENMKPLTPKITMFSNLFQRITKPYRFLLLSLITIVLCITLPFIPKAISQNTCNLTELNKFQDKNNNRSLEILTTCRNSLDDSPEKAEVLRRLALIAYDRVDSNAGIQSGTRAERIQGIESLLQESLDLGKKLNNPKLVSNANYSLAQLKIRELDRLGRMPIETDQSPQVNLQNALDLQTQIAATLQKFRDSEGIQAIPTSPNPATLEPLDNLEQLQPKLYQARLLIDYLPKLYSLVSKQNKAIVTAQITQANDIRNLIQEGVPLAKNESKNEPNPAEAEVKKLEQTMIAWTQDLVNLLQTIPQNLQISQSSNADSLALNIYHATTLRRFKPIAEGIHQHETDRQALQESLYLKTRSQTQQPSNKLNQPTQKSLTKPTYQSLFPIALQTEVQKFYSSANSDAANLLIQTIDSLRKAQLNKPEESLKARLKRNEIQAINALSSLYEDAGQSDVAASLINEQALLNADTLNSPEISGLLYGRAARIKLQQVRNQLKQSANQPANSNQTQQASRAALGLSETAIKRIELVRGELVSLSTDLQYNYRDSVEPIYRDNIELQLLQPNPDLKTILERVESLKIAEIHNYFREPCIETKVELDQFITQKLSSFDKGNANSIALIYTILQNDRLEIITKLPNQSGLHRYQSIVNRNQLNTTARNLKIHLQNNTIASANIEAAQIYQWIFNAKNTRTQTALAASLPENTTLVMVLDGSLREIPMNALYDSQRQEYLIDRYAIAISPGLKLFEPQTIQRPSILFSGQTQFPQGFQTLPDSQDELDRLTALLPPQKVLIDTNADRYQPLTLDNFRQLVAREPFNIVHLSTHASFSSQQENTFIAMGNGRITTDQFSEVLRQRTRTRSEAIELLILSACETVAGDDRAALGLAGMAIRSGARSTLASLWSINASVTTDVIIDFYEGLFKDNLSKANALRNAQLKLKKQGASLSEWSPYVIVGNWL